MSYKDYISEVFKPDKKKLAFKNQINRPYAGTDLIPRKKLVELFENTFRKGMDRHHWEQIDLYSDYKGKKVIDEIEVEYKKVIKKVFKKYDIL